MHEMTDGQADCMYTAGVDDGDTRDACHGLSVMWSCHAVLELRGFASSFVSGMYD